MGHTHHRTAHPTGADHAVPAAPMLVSACRPRIAVVGGSLTGPALALLLLQAGFDRVAVYEATPTAATLGGGLISLEHSALDVLDRAGIDQHEYVKAGFETITQTSYRDGADHTVRRVYPGRFTTWTLLHRTLAAHLPAGLIHYGRRVTGLADTRGGLLLRFADGEAEPADLVAFADGRASAGRRLLDPGRRLHYAGYVAHRGDSLATPAELADFRRVEPCPGVQFNIAPTPSGCDWTFYLNTTAAQYTALFGAPPLRRVFALPRHVSPAARHQVDAAAATHLPADHAAVVHAATTRMAVPIIDIDPPTQMVWPVGAGHAVLLGDALAPVRPHTARGANNGIEQAAGLVAALRQHRTHGADLAGALTGWQRRHLATAVAAVRLGPVIGARLGLGTASRQQPLTSRPLVAVSE
jgi:2-polyprenyl-6-methoxyphenol hydroxylase-like FAD-dependent oxidoreductase